MKISIFRGIFIHPQVPLWFESRQAEQARTLGRGIRLGRLACEGSQTPLRRKRQCPDGLCCQFCFALSSIQPQASSGFISSAVHLRKPAKLAGRNSLRSPTGLTGRLAPPRGAPGRAQRTDDLANHQ